jgi:hypothetical protein
MTAFNVLVRLSPSLSWRQSVFASAVLSRTPDKVCRDGSRLSDLPQIVNALNLRDEAACLWDADFFADPRYLAMVSAAAARPMPVYVVMRDKDERSMAAFSALKEDFGARGAQFAQEFWARLSRSEQLALQMRGLDRSLQPGLAKFFGAPPAFWSVASAQQPDTGAWLRRMFESPYGIQFPAASSHGRRSVPPAATRSCCRPKLPRSWRLSIRESPRSSPSTTRRRRRRPQDNCSTRFVQH